jgi:3-mercaptopyruvate sulfurtransferase SseA
MRLKRFLIAAAAAVLTAAVADAQYKTPAQTQTGPIKITPATPAVTSTAEVADELATARRISRADAMKMVKAKKAVYVDVRSKESFDEGHLPGAISVPLSELPARYKDLPFGTFLITYCA